MTTPRDSNLAIAIVEDVGARPLSINEIVGQGEVNHVFVVETNQGTWVVRFNLDPLDQDDYSKEAWCLTSAKEAGIPVPELIAFGQLSGVNYIVQSFVEGESGDLHRSPELWRILGEYARTIGEIELASVPDSLVSRFGRDLKASWEKHIQYNIDQLTADDRLLSLGVYEAKHAGALRDKFEFLRAIDHFGLTHGDVVPKNVIISQGKPVLIDWGSASTGPLPYPDYTRIWADDASEGFVDADLLAFAEGYGTPVSHLFETMFDLHLLHRIDVVRWAIDRRPDLIDECVGKALSITRRALN